MATIEERLAALEALLGMSEGETPYVSQYSGPDIDEGIELARSGTVRKTGDKMTGNLTVEKSGPTLLLKDTAESSVATIQAAAHRVYLQAKNDSASDAYRRQLQLMDSDAANSVKNAMRLVDYVDGAATTYYLYGEHNKPTPADIGAVSQAGDTMKGGLNFHPVGVTGYTQMYKNASSDSADYGTLMIDRDSTGKMIGLKLYSAAQKARIVDGTSEYDVLHTGNMDSLISSLRIATGTYTGTGNYGGTVTLTCGFKPAFAIVYQADANDLAVSEEGGGWSSTFAVLVPTATGRKIDIGQTSVSVESGDTYLKITSTAHELNQNIAYNYIIVGS